MKIKTKVALGVVALFAVIVVIAGVALFFIQNLSSTATNILKDNYESLEYVSQIIESSDSLQIDSNRTLASIEKNLVLQESNITEPGERELTVQLRLAFEKLRNGGITENEVAAIRKASIDIQKLNMQAIINKNALAENSSERATRVVMVIASILMIVAFTFIVNFPGYIANPISQLTASIKSIANRNYEERLHFERKDEFSELADAFNQMAEKLDEYEHSNLAKILFEKKRIETIINKMVDPIIGLDEKRKILFVNTEALKILAVPENELIGQYAPDVAVRNDLLRHLLSDLMNDGRQESQPIKPLKIFSEGKENYFTKDVLKVVTIATGERKAMLVGYVLILKNITPYKELDLAKTNFIATISHELKTPLASILMCVQLLEDNRVGDLNKEQHDILTTVREESNRLKRITGELLDMAQVESGNLRLHIESVRPKDIIEYAYKALKFQAEQKHVDIEMDCSDEASSVKADFDKTIWVMTNLLSNAIHYSPENSKVIIQAKHSNGKVVFSISDFGKGIDPDYQDKVFDKFYKIPGSGTMNSGTGLGLAISKEFIQSEGGRIWVESKPGEGSKFSFELSA